MQLTFDAIDEPQAGAQWKAQFDQFWPGYKAWFISRGGATHPAAEIASQRLRRYMPELESTYTRLVELAGGDELAARFLSCYRPPAYLVSCSQAAFRTPDGPVLIRNYDLDPRLNEGLILHTAWNGRRVIASSEFLWGVADGMNDAGLALSLAFGGRKIVGDGFGIPLILRYILEFCERTSEAIEVLRSVPSHMSYNITLIDADSRAVSVQVAPDRPTQVLEQPIATNHQGKPEWHEHARFTQSVERERALRALRRRRRPAVDVLLDAFHAQPLYSTDYPRGFGTLYTAVYRPTEGVARWHWPKAQWQQSFERFEPGARHVDYDHNGAHVRPPVTRSRSDNARSDNARSDKARSDNTNDTPSNAFDWNRSWQHDPRPWQEIVNYWVDFAYRSAQHTGDRYQ